MQHLGTRSPRRHRRLAAAAVAASLTVGVVGLGAPAATAAPTPLSASTRIAMIQGSMRLAVTYLQHTPNFVRRLAARVIVGEAKLLLSAPGTRPAGPNGAAPAAALATTAPPGVVLGGLILDSYCANLGFDHSEVNGPIVAPDAAFNWFCVSASGSLTPISIQAACLAQYPGPATIAFPQDVNDAFTWVCIAPTPGHFGTPDGTTVDVVTSPDGSAILISGPDGSYVATDQNGGAGTVDLNSDGSGSIACCGGSTGTLPVLTFEGGGSTLPV